MNSAHLKSLGAWLLCTPIAIAQTAASPNAPPKLLSSPVKLSALQDPASALELGQERVVIYRPIADTLAHPLRIYWADSYHASLFSGTHTELSVTPGPSTVGVTAVLPSASWGQPIDPNFVSGQRRHVRVAAITEQGLHWEELSSSPTTTPKSALI